MKKVYAFLFALALTVVVCAAIWFYTVPRMIRHFEGQGKKEQIDLIREGDDAREAITGVPAQRDR